MASGPGNSGAWGPKELTHGHGVLLQMQLIALNARMEAGTCCRCIPLVLGGFSLCALVFLRGLMLFGAVLVVWAVGDGDPFNAMDALNWYQRFFIALSFGDMTASLLGVVGMLSTATTLALVLPTWLFAHLVANALFGLYVSAYDLVGAGKGFTFFCVVLVLFLHAYFFLIAVRIALVVLLHESFDLDFRAVVERAQSIASAHGAGSCDAQHLVASLLQDGHIRQLLIDARADVADMDRAFGMQSLGEEREDDDRVAIAFGPAIDRVFADATSFRLEANDRLLTSEHVLLALFYTGTLSVPGPPGRSDVTPVFKADVSVILQRLHDLRRGSFHGAPGARILSCLPLEETVGVYLALQAFLCLASLFTLLFMGRGLGVAFGLRTVNEMRFLELLVASAGVGVGASALYGIHEHRQARHVVIEEAHQRANIWSVDLEHAFAMVRDHEESDEWLASFKHSCRMLGVAMAWFAADLLATLPMYGMYFINGNMCRSYVHGIASVSVTSHQILRTTMHCTYWDLVYVAGAVTWFALKTGMVWAIFCLWHEYRYGWTTTDTRGAFYMNHFSPLSNRMVRQLAGLPKYGTVES